VTYRFTRRYRMFAELLELSIAAGLWLEVSLPAYLPTSPTMASPDGAQVAESVLVSSNAPSTVLQHPGYYYYAAADCSVQRKQRFDKISGRITDSEHVDRAAKTQATPGLANEQRIDHTAIILEVGLQSPNDTERSLSTAKPFYFSFIPKLIATSNGLRADRAA
jgi:hypothetical protein